MKAWQKQKKAEKERQSILWQDKVQREREERARYYSTSEALDALLESLLAASDYLPPELVERVSDIQDKVDHSL